MLNSGDVSVLLGVYVSDWSEILWKECDLRESRMIGEMGGYTMGRRLGNWWEMGIWEDVLQIGMDILAVV